MKELTYLWQHHKAVIKCPENEADLREFAQWILSHKGEWIACDTETTGLDIFSADYKCRRRRRATACRANSGPRGVGD